MKTLIIKNPLKSIASLTSSAIAATKECATKACNKVCADEWSIKVPFVKDEHDPTFYERAVKQMKDVWSKEGN